ncbi:hypothetical protein FJT64_022830 [Amphibalanus amphitrite]|uniref:Uncharacterized protein n=1 Tax=Amphibalanus amphitrite TaxID=1232801 RepID=A0A6A4WP64_AMPAM|nr:hypothetical protein FJT64_022830 [Amphibalanus amphitrite]
MEKRSSTAPSRVVRVVRRFCASLLEVRVWTAVGVTGCIIALGFFASAIFTQYSERPVQGRVDEALTGGAAPEPGALPVLLLLPSFSSSQARSHYQQQLTSLLQHCRSPLSLHLMVPAQHILELAQLMEELVAERHHPPSCRPRYTLLRGGEQLAAATDQRQRGRQLLTVLRQLAPLGRVVFLDEQTVPVGDLGPLLAELEAFPEQRVAAGAPEDTARYLSRAHLEGATELPRSDRFLLDELFTCRQPPLVVSTAGRAESDWEQDVIRQWTERTGPAQGKAA